MKEIIRKFTCGHPEHMIKPTVWLFIESFSMGFPAIATYFAINYIVQAFTSPANINGLCKEAVQPTHAMTFSLIMCLFPTMKRPEIRY